MSKFSYPIYCYFSSSENIANMFINAVKDNDEPFLDYLIENQFRHLFNYYNTLERLTPIIYLLKNQKSDLLVKILSNPSVIETISHYFVRGNNILHYAAINDADHKIWEELIKIVIKIDRKKNIANEITEDSFFYIRNAEGLNFLHILAMKGHKQSFDSVLSIFDAEVINYNDFLNASISKDYISPSGGGKIGIGSKALDFACYFGHDYIVEKLIEKGSKYSYFSMGIKDSPLHHACYVDRANILKIVDKAKIFAFILSKLTDEEKLFFLKLKNRNQDTAIRYIANMSINSISAKPRYLEAMQIFSEALTSCSEKVGIEIFKDNDQRMLNLLHLSILNNNYILVSNLLSSCAELAYGTTTEKLLDNSWNIHSGSSALHLASYFGDARMLDLVFTRGNFSVEDVDEVIIDAAIHHAAYRLNLDNLKYLIEKGANPNVQNDDGWTATMCALESDFYSDNQPQILSEIISFLIKSGADINIGSQRGILPLIRMIQLKQFNVINLLLEDDTIRDTLFASFKQLVENNFENLRECLKEIEDNNIQRELIQNILQELLIKRNIDQIFIFSEDIISFGIDILDITDPITKKPVLNSLFKLCSQKYKEFTQNYSSGKLKSAIEKRDLDQILLIIRARFFNDDELRESVRHVVNLIKQENDQDDLDKLGTILGMLLVRYDSVNDEELSKLLKAINKDDKSKSILVSLQQYLNKAIIATGYIKKYSKLTAEEKQDIPHTFLSLSNIMDLDIIEKKSVRLCLYEIYNELYQIKNIKILMDLAHHFISTEEQKGRTKEENGRMFYIDPKKDMKAILPLQINFIKDKNVRNASLNYIIAGSKENNGVTGLYARIYLTVIAAIQSSNVTNKNNITEMLENEDNIMEIKSTFIHELCHFIASLLNDREHSWPFKAKWNSDRAEELKKEFDDNIILPIRKRVMELENYLEAKENYSKAVSRDPFRNLLETKEKEEIHMQKQIELINSKKLDSILYNVFTAYEKVSFHTELIVRIPELIAKYGEEQGLKIIKAQCPELYEYYQEEFIPACIEKLGYRDESEEKSCKALEIIREIRRIDLIDKTFLKDRFDLNDEDFIPDDFGIEAKIIIEEITEIGNFRPDVPPISRVPVLVK